MGAFKFLFSFFLLTCMFALGVQKNETWDYLIFAQEWPPTYCTYNCSIPKDLSGWTIHGLWPSRFDGDDVSFCCKEEACRFNPKLIEDIKDDLTKCWPNIFANQSVYDFWKHEWRRHGTCATSLPALGGEHEYFKKVLELYKRFNVYNILKNGGVVPSDSKTYTFEELTQSTKGLLGDKQIKFGCQNTKKYDLLDSVHICLNKDFDVINCPKNGSACDQHPIRYVPYKSSEPSGHSSWYYFAATVLCLSFIALVVALVWYFYTWWKKREETRLYSTM